MKKYIIALPLFALMFTACDPSKTDLGSPDANYTASELENLFTVTQNDADGNPAADGNYFHFKTKDLARPVQIIRIMGGAENVVASGFEGNFAIRPSRGQDPNVSYIVRVVNFDGTHVDIEKTATVFVPTEMAMWQKLLASEAGEKTWYWDTEATDGVVWGNMGYCGGAGSEVGLNSNGKWWGVTSEADFLTQGDHTSDGFIGDEKMDSKMIFKEDGTVRCELADGTVFRNGSYEVEDFDYSDPSAWKVGNLKTTAGAILWPFEINSGGNKPTTFEICYLTVNKMALVYPDGGAFDGLGSWGEATFWHFKSDSDKAGAITDYKDDGKAWTWNTEATDGVVWGNMGYCGGSGAEVGLNSNGKWWGVTSEADFLTQGDHSSDGFIGDEKMDSYMVFGNDGTINAYTADGNKFRSGVWEFEAIEGNDWKVGDLKTTAGSILWPFEINSGGNKPTQFEVVYLTGNRMTLVYPDKGDFGSLGSWGEATFWQFKAK